MEEKNDPAPSDPAGASAKNNYFRKKMAGMVRPFYRGSGARNQGIRNQGTRDQETRDQGTRDQGTRDQETRDQETRDQEPERIRLTELKKCGIWIGMVQVRKNIRVDDDLYREFKRVCKEENKIIYKVVEDMMRNYIEHSDDRRKLYDLARKVQ